MFSDRIHRQLREDYCRSLYFANKILLMLSSRPLIDPFSGSIADPGSLSIDGIEKLIKDREQVCVELSNDVFIGPIDKTEPLQLALYLAELWERWAPGGRFAMNTSLVRLGDFERVCGRLRVSSKMDLPPYTELLMQSSGIAFRHPEYQLSRDLEYCYGLFLDSDRLLESVDWSSATESHTAGSECNLALGRMTILACFNLMEAFVCGLAEEYLYSHADELTQEEQKKLANTDTPLRKRVLDIPKLVTAGRFALSSTNPLFQRFFDIKRRRDSFVHCRPGDQPSRWGTIKESLFHDISCTLVNDAVQTVHDLVVEIWYGVHRRPRPNWLIQIPLRNEPCFRLRWSSGLQNR